MKKINNKIKFFGVISLLVVFGFLLFLKSGPENHIILSSTFEQNRFSVESKEGLQMLLDSDLYSDFETYNFSLKGENFMWAYYGNHPSYPSYAPLANIKEVEFKVGKGFFNVIGSNNAKCVIWNKNKKYCLECLIKKNSADSPQYIHLWALNNSKEIHLKALDIIKTLRF